MLVVGVVAAAVAGAMAAVAPAGRGWLLVLLLAVQLGFVLAWTALLDTPSPAGAVAVSAGAAAASDGVLLRVHHVALGVFATIVALAFLFSLLWQIARRERTRVTESLAATVTATVLAVAGGAYLTLRAGLNGEQPLTDGRQAATAALLGVATVLGVGRLVDAAWARPALSGSLRRGLPGLVAGLGAAAAVGAWYGSQRWTTHGDGLFPGAGFITGPKVLLVALVAAAVAAAVDLGIDAGLATLAKDGPDRRPAPWPARLGVATLLPVLVAAPPAYVVARIVLT
ncbi:MAG: hypothetical protein QOJ11_186 [Frankiales bacterium]|nr:hypothetical protein [Frankiales bacterium]